MHTVHGEKFFTVFHSDQSLVRLFSIFFLNLFYLLEGVAITSYAGDITPCSAKKTNKVVIKETEHFSEVLFKWFDFNYMRINCQKRYILF